MKTSLFCKWVLAVMLQQQHLVEGQLIDAVTGLLVGPSPMPSPVESTPWPTTTAPSAAPVTSSPSPAPVTPQPTFVYSEPVICAAWVVATVVNGHCIVTGTDVVNAAKVRAFVVFYAHVADFPL
jgi:hypothetical protein